MFLTDLVNLQTAQIALSTPPDINMGVWPQNDWHKLSFNTVFNDTGIGITLEPSLSSFTLPSGLYQLEYSNQGGELNASGTYYYYQRLIVNGNIVYRWPAAGITGATLSNPGNGTFHPCRFFLDNTSTVSLEQYWTNSMRWVTIGSTNANIGYHLFQSCNILKLK